MTFSSPFDWDILPIYVKIPAMNPLPIDPLLPQIVEALDKNHCAVVTAEPGAGKTTRVPPALLTASFAKDREIWVLQPRRLAAKLAALRVAEEMGEEAGKTVGYQFRFEKRLSPSTRLLFMTDGMLLPLSQNDPQLSKVAAVVLDEFHERSLALELGLAWLRRLQLSTRPDLRLLVMSATLDAKALSAYLSDCPVLKSEGRVFPVNVEYLPQPEKRDLDQKVRSAVAQLTSQGVEGTTLVFLPGMAEISRCQEALKKTDAEVHALYGDLPVEEQQRVLRPSKGRKVILSTNVAETSITVPGVTAVVDSGLTRQSRVSAWSGLESLVTVPASQASSAQRTGRAGRLQAGVCLRLYSKYDFDHRPSFDLPELMRSDLSRSLLDLKTLGVDDLENFPWFLKPSSASLDAAITLLKKLGALDKGEKLTSLGRRMARFPLAPRLAKFVLEVEKMSPQGSHALSNACRLSALISEGSSQDLLEDLHRFKPGFESKRIEEQVAGLLKTSPPTAKVGVKDQEILSKGLLMAFPDRVAQVREGRSSETRHRDAHTRELILCGGGTAVAQDDAMIRENEYFVVVEAQEVGPKAQVKARSLCPVEADWLLDLVSEGLSEEKTCEWNAKAGRVEGFKRLTYGQLVLDEKPLSPGDFGEETANLLYKQALSAGPSAYCDEEELGNFLSRARFAAERAGFPSLTDEVVKETLAELCRTCRSFEDLKKADLVGALRAKLDPKNQALLELLAPSRTTLPGGRSIAIHYEEGKPPWAESRLQDFFGMTSGPTVGGGQVPVVLHLLSPAKRPVQITSDLAGFWKNHYPQIRKELSRRYPRHKWPENPIS